jgi:hypothetical protein
MSYLKIRQFPPAYYTPDLLVDLMVELDQVSDSIKEEDQDYGATLSMFIEHIKGKRLEVKATDFSPVYPQKQTPPKDN